MKNCFLPLALAASFPAFSQLNITYQVNTTSVMHAISPYIYGQCNGGYDNATLRRQGGNRMTGYNWENNASNAGNDYFHQSDDYLPWVMNVPLANYHSPAIVTRAFHDSSLVHNAMDAVTLQMAGYVAKDDNGTTVETWEAAPSPRWAQVLNHKPTAFSLTPDVNDNFVYMDEYLNFLINQYGNAASPTGIKAYILDNEAALWTSTHPRLYTGVNSCVDHLNKSISLAKTVRQMDANALILGPESYGYTEYMSFQNASDWSAYSGSYSHYLAAYLDSMQEASAAYGSRLLDVFTIHWYPDVYAGSVYSSNTSPAIASERMQIPRSLWDSTYVENSWIGQWFSQDLPILPKLQSLIDTWYPGTKLGVTEYDYGGDEHISGGIAQVEALGAFARTGTAYATKWDEFRAFSLSGIQLYRDVAEPFGNQYVFSGSSDQTNSSIFSSISNNDDNELHIITTNKNTDSLIFADFQVASSGTYDSISVYFFTQNDPAIQSLQLSPALLNASGFSYVLDPLTAYHFVLRKSENTAELSEGVQRSAPLICYPNPAKQALYVQLTPGNSESSLIVTSVSGQSVMTKSVAPASAVCSLSIEHLQPGTYFLQHVTSGGIRQAVFVKE